MAKGKVVLKGQARRKSKVNLANTFGVSAGSSGSGATNGAVTQSRKGGKISVAAAKRKVVG